MDFNAAVSLLPYAIALGISLLVGAYCLTRREVPGASPYGWLAIAQAVWAGAYILRLASPLLEQKLMWADVEWLATFFIPYTYPIFTAQFIGYSPNRVRRLRVLLGIVPILLTILLLTDGYHHLFYPNPHIVPGIPFSRLDTDFTPLTRGFGIYGVVIIFVTIAALAERFIRPHHLYRSQILAVIIASLIPTVSTILTLTNVTPYDSTPLTFIARNLIVGWALFRFHLFDIVPVARETIVETINELVIVLDSRNRVIDVNRAALAALGKPLQEVIGHTAREVFAAWPDLVERFQNVEQARVEIAIDIRGRSVINELGISPLLNHAGEQIGRVVVARDVTERRKMEADLRQLNEDLERRVDERTRELAQAYDTTLEGWAKALELRDKETEGHSRRVTDLTLRLARTMNVSPEDIVHIRRGAILHDIGKMAIPDEILRKRGSLTDEERAIVSQHPLIAYQLLAPIPFLARALEIPYAHHERWNGAGYPRGLKGEEIPLSARIFSVADVWDAVRSDRPYNRAWSEEESIRYLREQAGQYFDPSIVEVFLAMIARGDL